MSDSKERIRLDHWLAALFLFTMAANSIVRLSPNAVVMIIIILSVFPGLSLYLSVKAGLYVP